MEPIPERQAILDFLRELKTHNDRDWFEANRRRYERARASFQAIVGELIDGFDPVDDLGGVTVKECVFRIHRDLRFSADKTPYKTAMTALLGRGGRQSKGRSYYFHVEPDGQSILACGLWKPTSAELGKMRQALADDSKPFRKIIGAPGFRRYFGSPSGDSLKSAPQGYAKDHPDIDLLRMKQFMAVHGFDDELLVSAKLVPETLAVFGAMKPFLAYIESAIE